MVSIREKILLFCCPAPCFAHVHLSAHDQRALGLRDIHVGGEFLSCEKMIKYCMSKRFLSGFHVAEN